MDNAPWSRNSRFWAAYGGNWVTLPEVMVDSGHLISNGYVAFHDVYKSMVDAELARPAQAQLEARWSRIGDRAVFRVRLVNESGQTLSRSTNCAAVHGIVYEEAHVRTTDRFVRAAVSADIPNLLPGAETEFTLQTPELDAVNWDKLRFVAVADYCPLGNLEAYDMLQAVVATMPFAVDPEAVSFLVDLSDITAPSTELHLHGSEHLTWTATVDVPWVTMDPLSGTMAARPVVSVVPGLLSAGVQWGSIAFIAANGVFTDALPARAYYGTVSRSFLPIISRTVHSTK